MISFVMLSIGDRVNIRLEYESYDDHRISKIVKIEPGAWCSKWAHPLREGDPDMGRILEPALIIDAVDATGSKSTFSFFNEDSPESSREEYLICLIDHDNYDMGIIYCGGCRVFMTIIPPEN